MGYQRPVVSLVVLTDQRRRWRPTRYRRALGGCEARLRYPLVKLLDYRGREAELEAQRNPFAVVTLAHLKAQETAKDPGARYRWKWRLVQDLYERGCASGGVGVVPVSGLDDAIAGSRGRSTMGGVATV
jgi:hypothetical protein